MQIPAAPDLLARIARLPAGDTVLERLSAGTSQPVALVGGAVRDLLLGEAAFDLDLVVEGPVDEIVDRLGGDSRAHERFGTAQVLLAGHRIDIASARTEVYARPGALPEVAPARLEDDLERRDFTINAVAVRLNGPDMGAFLSVPGAVDDLATRSLRVLHARSFRDDPTRLLRLARYAARLCFGAEPVTLGLFAVAVREGALGTISGSRIGNELRLSAGERDPVLALAALRELGLDRAIDRGFGLTDDAWAGRALELLGSHGRPDRLVLALAVRRLGPARAAALLDELAFVAEDRDAIVQAADAPALSAAMSEAKRPSELARAVARAGPEAVALAGALGPAQAAELWLSELRFVRIGVDGHDLLAAGVPAGPAVGRGLAAALDAARDGDARDRQAQLEVALRAARDPAVR